MMIEFLDTAAKVMDLLERAAKEKDPIKIRGYRYKIDQLGLLKSGDWSPDEDRRIAEDWGKRSAVSIGISLRRTAKNVAIRAKRLGLPTGSNLRNQGSRWQPEDIQFLIGNWGKVPTPELAERFGRTINSVVTEMLAKLLALYKQPASKSNVPAILDMIATGLDETKIRLKLRVTDDEMEDALDLAARLIGRFAVANADKETVRKKTGSGQQTMTNRRKRLRAAAAGRRAK